MPKEKIIKEQVSRTEEQPLNLHELQLLKDKVYRQVMIYLPGYLLLLAGAFLIYLNAPESFKVIVSRKVRIDEEESSRMWRLAPYVSVFVVVMASIFFGKIYNHSILPLLKDIKQKTKLLVFYKPEKNAMAVFNRYYISAPLHTKRQLQVDSNDFNLITDSDELCLELSRYSLIVLAIKKDSKQIKYQEPVSRL